MSSFFPSALLSLCAVLFTTNTWAEDTWARDKLTVNQMFPLGEKHLVMDL